MLNQPHIPQILKKSLFNGGEFAELFYENTKSTTIICEDKRIEQITSGIDQGVGLRVIDNLNTVYGFTNEPSKNSLYDLATKISEALQGNVFDKDIDLKKQVPNVVFPIQKDPLAITSEQKIALCQKASELAWSLDKRVVQVRIRYNDVLRQIQLANSLGEFVDTSKTLLSFVIMVTVSDGKEFYTSYDLLGGHCGYELFDESDLNSLTKKTVNRALQNLQARRAPGGSMPVVLSSEAGGTMIHEAVGHGLEADLACHGLSVFSGKLGEQIASPLVTVIDDGTLPLKRGSFSFDDEGNTSKKNVLIQDGVLKNYMFDRIMAMKQQSTSTGNGRRESYEYRPIVRMTNTFVAPGKDDPQEIVKSVNRGLFVKKMGGGQVNTVNGDFVFDVTEGYLIENGVIGEPVRGATLTGNGPDVIKIIDRVGTDLGFSMGMCGKGGQGAPVTDAIPTMRIPEMVVGGSVG